MTAQRYQLSSTYGLTADELAPLRARRLVNALHAQTPPTVCPGCERPATAPVRDPEGLWTWNCPGGCNP